MALKGIVPVLVTPMHRDGRPDREGHMRLLDYLMDSPITGLFVLGSGAEAFNMAYEHRLAVARIVTTYVEGKLFTIVGAGDPVLREIYRFFEDTADLPVGGYHVLATDRKMNTSFAVDYYTDLAERSPRPLWLYSNPARALQPTVEAVRILSEHPNIAGMKVGGYDLNYIIPMAQLNSPSFEVLGAGGGNLLAYLAYGVEGVTMSTGSCFPREYSEVYRLWQEGKLEAARHEAFRLIRVFSSLPARRNTEASAEEKAVLEVLGICQRWVYPPFTPCTDEQVAQIRDVLAANDLLLD